MTSLIDYKLIDIPIVGNPAMGMFDYIKYECKCPVCEETLNSFQSKDHDCLLHTLNPEDVSNFYDYCETCNTFVMFEWVKVKNKKNEKYKERKQKLKMIKPDMSLVKDFTKEDMIKNIKNENNFIRGYCHYKLMPFKKEKQK